MLLSQSRHIRMQLVTNMYHNTPARDANPRQMLEAKLRELEGVSLALLCSRRSRLRLRLAPSSALFGGAGNSEVAV